LYYRSVWSNPYTGSRKKKGPKAYPMNLSSWTCEIDQPPKPKRGCNQMHPRSVIWRLLCLKQFCIFQKILLKKKIEKFIDCESKIRGSIPQSIILGLMKSWLIHCWSSTSLLTLDGVKVIGSPNGWYLFDIFKIKYFEVRPNLSKTLVEGKRTILKNFKRIVISNYTTRPKIKLRNKGNIYIYTHTLNPIRDKGGVTESKYLKTSKDQNLDHLKRHH